MNLEIANRLVALRRERGLSQEDLAARLGVSRQAISKWERAESSPDTDNLIALARLYGISLDELLLQPAQGGDRCESQYAYASQTGPAAAEEAEDEQAEVFAAAREWDEAERAWEKQQKKVFEKKKQALLWLLTLVLMVALPAASAVLGLGVLELGNAAAELDALLRVLNCRIRCGLSFAADLSRTLQEQLFAKDFF